jgi:hypothetical protein
VLSLLVVFLVSAVLQIIFQPYAFAKLHRMHLVSTSCLATTTLGALAMFAYEIQESTALPLRITIAVLVILVNMAFVGWCVWKLVPVVKNWGLALLAFSKTWGPGLVEAARAWSGHPTQRGRQKGRGVQGRPKVSRPGSCTISWLQPPIGVWLQVVCGQHHACLLLLSLALGQWLLCLVYC